jgi:hypothetical protein
MLLISAGGILTRTVGSRPVAGLPGFGGTSFVISAAPE